MSRVALGTEEFLYLFINQSIHKFPGKVDGEMIMDDISGALQN